MGASQQAARHSREIDRNAELGDSGGDAGRIVSRRESSAADDGKRPGRLRNGLSSGSDSRSADSRRRDFHGHGRARCLASYEHLRKVALYIEAKQAADDPAPLASGIGVPSAHERLSI